MSTKKSSRKAARCTTRAEGDALATRIPTASAAVVKAGELAGTVDASLRPPSEAGGPRPTAAARGTTAKEAEKWCVCNASVVFMCERA
jgi:hypothetical protein